MRPPRPNTAGKSPSRDALNRNALDAIRDTKHYSPLYAITHLLGTSADDSSQLYNSCAAALRGGASVLQYRDKHANQSLLRERGTALAGICKDHGKLLIINDHLWLAEALVEQGHQIGLHVGGDDVAIQTARAALPDSVIGASCYNSIERAEQALAHGADYLAFGAVFPSPTKEEASAASLATVTRAREKFKLPIVAIGGITADRAQTVLTAGAHFVAVISDLFTAESTPKAIEYRAQEYSGLHSEPHESNDR